MLEKTLESPLDWKEIKPVNPKGNQSWIFIGTTDTEAEAPILWPPDAKNWLIRKHCEAWKDWRQEEEGTTEDEIVEWHHHLSGHVWARSGGWWWTGKPGVLQSMGLHRVRQDWATVLNWTAVNCGDFGDSTEDVTYNFFIQGLFLNSLWYTNLFGS